MKKTRFFHPPGVPCGNVRRGAGVFAGYSDEAYEAKGCKVTSRGDTIDKSEAGDEKFYGGFNGKITYVYGGFNWKITYVYGGFNGQIHYQWCV